MFWYYLKDYFEQKCSRIVWRFLKNKQNVRFPIGVQREEIQQWRQARSRPRDKEALNIMLREKWVKITNAEYA